MVATKNPTRNWLLLLATVALGVFCGCTPPGPRALLQGEDLLHKGKLAEAVVKLKTATELLREEPRAYNLLGLAYHRSGQLQLAAQAYRQALTRDRSNLVAVAHFNLGCLLLEQNNPAGAADELRSYTLTTNSLPGLIKLGTAQLRLRQFPAAEVSLTAALRLDQKHPEVLNGLGVLHAQRGQRDAAQFFGSALQASPKYGPALLNAALVGQQNSATKPAALQRCREYLALHPQSPQAGAVQAMARQLEIDLTPARPVLVPTSPVVQVAPALRSNLVTTVPAPSLTNVPPATSALPRVATLIKPTPVVVLPKTNPAVVATNPLAEVSKVPVTVVVVTNEPAPRIAVADPVTLAVVKPVVVPVPKPATAPATSITDPRFESPADSPKPGFFTRLNPFRGKPAPATNAAPVVEASRTIVLNPSAHATPAARPVFPRYNHSVKNRPAAGNRADAERAAQQAARAQRGGRTNEALLDYQLAVNADPSFFDAQYNAALLALLSGDLPRALSGYEAALAIEPDSINARYNFALALKQGGYAHDAASELQRILEAKPNETRAHLTLANLFAQQLEDADRARPHYVKVIELDARNPQSAAIRFWLAAHP